MPVRSATARASERSATTSSQAVASSGCAATKRSYSRKAAAEIGHVVECLKSRKRSAAKAASSSASVRSRSGTRAKVPSARVKVLVTGGNGFLGRAIVTELKRRGHAVSSASRRPSRELDALGVRTFTCDLRNREHVERAVAGQEAVVHAAALTGLAGARADFVRTNVEGTRFVIDACRAGGVARLVYTSSPSVVFDGRDHRRADESLPYARRPLAAYPATKAAAEREVLAANDARLATLALRPHLVLGPGDPNLMPRLVARARAGKLAIVGRGDNEVSFTWVENAAAAHADALERLEPGARAAGRAFFVAQKEPVALWPWLGELFTRAGIPPPRRRVSRAF